MKRAVAVLALLLLVAGCGRASDDGTVKAEGKPAAGPSASTQAPVPVPTATALPPAPTTTPTPPAGGPHFETPEEAMRYLADAWNRNDITSLKHVTDPGARDQLVAMHDEASNLALDHCTYTKERGDYECFFIHTFPPGYKAETPGALYGTAEFTVGPARKPGWYMTFFVDCGG